MKITASLIGLFGHANGLDLPRVQGGLQWNAPAALPAMSSAPIVSVAPVAPVVQVAPVAPAVQVGPADSIAPAVAVAPADPVKVEQPFEAVQIAETPSEPVFASPSVGPYDLSGLPALNSPPPSSSFVFHNKLPKSGSTTMKYIISTLQKANDFHMDYQSPCINKATCATDPADGIGAESTLANHVREQREQHPGKFILLKHQYWLNFTRFEMEQPTYINVVRDPVTRFASMYYFNRYGFKSMGSKDRQGVQRHSWKGTEEDIARTLDMCMEEQNEECTEPLQVLVRYFCGTDQECNMKSSKMGKFGALNNWDKVAKAAELAKKKIVTQYYSIGLMEKFDETLALFENMLPGFFKGAQAAYRSQFVQNQRESSKTAHTDGFSNSTRTWLEQGPLKYEVDLYNLISAIFYERLSYFGITADTTTADSTK
ncbi:Oidioi.mRNA.OKI2018_I69.XSR.g14693.t1.cds [Oikopleura dioica]|uniref:Oidioi.mRNA.OKI2018_I69.XSR.g14693.t1.cds n=1 Tax=Oikopleura dioica TaxID=34765 RepID=A0ABN7SAJ8_OIKDI|nr:Oidioi.mRNA.OKI2018_I69.XSR.g14693.t1.cds [Oikopleura dioica]